MSISKYTICKGVLLLLVVVALAPPAHASVIQRQPNNLGFVGYWSMNEGVGTQVGDFSGNGHSGAFVGSPTWVSGKFGTALSFNGSTDYVNPGNVSTGVMTVAFWVNSANATQKIIDINGTALVEVSGNTITATNFPAATIYVDGVAGTTITTGDWHHVVITDSTGVNASAFKIGSAASAFFSGKLDEVRLYNRALSAVEAAALYKSGASRTGASSATLNNGSTLTSGLVGYWTFDGSTINWNTGLAADSSGTGNSLSLINMSTTSSPTGGKLGQALKLSSSSQTYLTKSSPTGLPNTQSPQTMSAWVNFSTTSPNNALGWFDDIINRDDNTGAREEFFCGTGGCGVAQWSGAAIIQTPSTISINQWHLVTFTYDGSNNTMYIDGVFSTSNTNGADTGTPNILEIGGSGRHSENFAEGKIDDVRIYNRALSASEVKQLYSLGNGKIVGGCTQSASFLARTSGLNAAHIKAYQNLICNLVADGVWSKLDVFYIFATQNQATANLNLVNSSFTATAQGAPTFTADSGYTTASDKYVSSNYNFSTNSTHYTQNSASIGGWSGSTGASTYSAWDTGTVFSGNTFIQPFNSPTTNFSINGGSQQAVTNNGNASGMFALVRQDTNTEIMYRNGASLGSAVDSALALENGVFETGGNNAVASSAYAGIIRSMFAGGGLTAADAASFYSAMRTYMQTVGATP